MSKFFVNRKRGLILKKEIHFDLSPIQVNIVRNNQDIKKCERVFFYYYIHVLYKKKMEFCKEPLFSMTKRQLEKRIH